MTDPQIAVMMLGIFILVIFLGFPIAFTLMAMGVMFGYYAYYDPERMQTIFDNRIFDLLVNQTYSVMANDVLTAIPLFLFMGYIVERANIVDRLFDALRCRRAPPARFDGGRRARNLRDVRHRNRHHRRGGHADGAAGLPAMLKARYDTSFASGVICAGGCLGILIPPSIMLIVYAATSNVSIVKLYAGAIIPGFMLAGLYMVYVVGPRGSIPSLAPKPREEEVGEIVHRLRWSTCWPPPSSRWPFSSCRCWARSCSGSPHPSEAAAVGRAWRPAAGHSLPLR